MIEKVVIMIIALLNQINVIPQDQTSLGFLDRVLEEEVLDAQKVDSNLENWNYFIGNLKIGNVLEPLPYRTEGFSSFEIDARSSVALDVGTNTVLYSKEKDRIMPIASLTKIMTAMIVLDRIGLEDAVIVKKSALKTSGKRDNLKENEEIRASDLFKLMLVNSNNTAAVVFAEHISGSEKDFVKLMNEKAKVLGLEHTQFFNATGLDEIEENYSTALETAQMYDYALKYPVIWEALKIQKLDIASVDKKIKHKLRNTNLLLGKMVNLEGGKTGFTDDAGECLVLVTGDPKDNHKIISVILNSKDRFKDTEKMIKWVFDSYRW